MNTHTKTPVLERPTALPYHGCSVEKCPNPGVPLGDTNYYLCAFHTRAWGWFHWGTQWQDESPVGPSGTFNLQEWDSKFQAFLRVAVQEQRRFGSGPDVKYPRR